MCSRRLPWWFSGKESACPHAGDAGLILGLERSPGGGNVNLFHCSCLGNPMVREEPGRLHSMWSQRVRHNLVAKQQTTKLVSVKYMC